jgi:hypothetical protein
MVPNKLHQWPAKLHSDPAVRRSGQWHLYKFSVYEFVTKWTVREL